jgi:hypothetical protein
VSAGDRRIKMNRCLIFVSLFLAWTISVTTNEPLWTDQERGEKRDMVCLGTVLSVKKIANINQYSDLYLAVIKIDGMKKGKKTSVGSKINVYFEFSTTGKNIRCPRYAELAAGDKDTFYLRNITEAVKKMLKLETVKEPAYFLEMGSDVREKTGTSG